MENKRASGMITGPILESYSHFLTLKLRDWEFLYLRLWHLGIVMEVGLYLLREQTVI